MKLRNEPDALLFEDMLDTRLRSASAVSQLTGYFFETATAAITGGQLLSVDTGHPDVYIGPEYAESKASYLGGRWKLDYGQKKMSPKLTYYFLWVYMTRGLLGCKTVFGVLDALERAGATLFVLEKKDLDAIQCAGDGNVLLRLYKSWTKPGFRANTEGVLSISTRFMLGRFHLDFSKRVRFNFMGRGVNLNVEVMDCIVAPF